MLDHFHIALLVIIAIQALIYEIRSQKLINKAMSRSFYDYSLAANVKNRQKEEVKSENVDFQDETADAIAALSEF